MGFFARLNDAVVESPVGRFFEMKARNTTLGQEIRGGVVTFLTVAYLLAVNSNILSQTGGTCVEDGICLPGVPPAFQDPGCQECITNLRSSLISATAATCIISHFLMGVLGNLPLAVVPAMGLNAYFTYTVVGFMATGRVKYSAAVTAVFVEGFIFMIITLLGVRSKLVELMPRPVLYATSVGIGLFLAFIGMQGSEGLGVTSYNSATLVTLGGCSPAYRTPQYTVSESAFASPGSPDSLCVLDPVTGDISVNGGLMVPSDAYSCSSAGVMRSATMWLGIAGGMIMVVLMCLDIKGAIAVGILFVTFISWIPSSGNLARYIEKPYGCQPSGINSNSGEDCIYTPEMRRWDFFKQVVAVPDTSLTAGKFSFSGFKNGDLWVALITFLYVDFLDATSTLFTMANYISMYIPGFVDIKRKRFPRQTHAFMVDGASISVGACLGLSPLTVAIESASGIREGARTGLAALTIGFCFFCSLFFAPLLATVPPYATGPAIILVGALMMANVTKIRWHHLGDAVPAFLTIIVMPMTYSVAYGFIAGIFGYMIINSFLLVINFCKAHLSPESKQPPGTPLKAKLRSYWEVATTSTFQLGDEDEEEELPIEAVMEAKRAAKKAALANGGGGEGSGSGKPDDLSEHKGDDDGMHSQV